MLSSWTPARRRGVEILDDRGTPEDVRRLAMADVIRANRLFGGTRAAVEGFRAVLPDLPRQALHVDVGTGLADFVAHAQREARRADVTLTTLGMDISEPLLRAARSRVQGSVVSDALRIPLADASVDIITCSQLLHHFVDEDARRVIAELHRIARGWVLVSDLHRSWFAAGGFWIASGLLGFHPVTRADGVTSVLRGFTATELDSLVRDAVGISPRIVRHAFWRLNVAWKKPSP
jgi:SAM-dependent methyltransferase